MAITYAFVDEVHQFFVALRSATLIDLAKDAAGVMASWWILHRAYFNRARNNVLEGSAAAGTRVDETGE